ncbi:MAG: hypothetical protein EXQ50_05325 [Acidobacteria bacterium]|nr:hypothetical protein [Acidobacteriota bacterium]
MGEVYRAKDTKLNRDVAIKVLPAAVAGDAERLARFQREAEVLAALNHPNIAAIYGLEEGPAKAGHHEVFITAADGALKSIALTPDGDGLTLGAPKTLFTCRPVMAASA